MGRPRRVIFENFPQYNKLHTIKQRMMSGAQLTILYPIKETEQFWMSPEVWAFCASKFRMKKKNMPELSVDIPILTDEIAIKWLDEFAWHDWVGKERNDKKSDIPEAVSLLKNIFPKHEIVYFYEFSNIVTEFTWDNLNTHDEPSDHIKWINLHVGNKYKDMTQYPEVKALYDKYRNSKDNVSDEERTKLYRKYSESAQQTAWEKHNTIDMLNNIGRNSVCYPVAFSKGTGMWAVEKYGKPTEYSNAGEIFFIVTPDKIYFEVKRHY